MKIKKQLILLCLVIILTPLFLCTFIFIHNYKISPERILFSDYKDITSINKDLIPKNDLEKIKKVLNNLPPNIDFLIFTNTPSILITNFSEFENYEEINNQIINDHISKTIDTFFYQITSIETNENTYTYVNRILKANKKNNKINALDYLMWGIATFYLFCIFIIIKLSNTITKSIGFIEDKTYDLANGNLTKKIETSELKYQNEITQITHSLEKVRTSLLDAQNRKNKIIMGVSHDLRTPVSVIRGYTEALKDNIFSDENEKKIAIDLILSKSNQLEVMIDTLINYIKINTSSFKELFTKTNVFEFINPITKEFAITAEIFKRNFIINIQIDKNINIMMNTSLIFRVLENLYSNAIRYTNENDYIYLNAIQTEKSIQISIKDTGKGINKEDLDNIFDIFYRGSNSRLEDGMGIGLSIVDDIIKLHKWKIEVTSEINKGSCFTLIIPI